MDSAFWAVDFYKDHGLQLIIIFFISIVLIVIFSFIKVFFAKRQAERQVQRDIDEAIYRKKIEHIADEEYKELYSSRDKK